MEGGEVTARHCPDIHCSQYVIVDLLAQVAGVTSSPLTSVHRMPIAHGGDEDIGYSVPKFRKRACTATEWTGTSCKRRFNGNLGSSKGAEKASRAWRLARLAPCKKVERKQTLWSVDSARARAPAMARRRRALRVSLASSASRSRRLHGDPSVESSSPSRLGVTGT